MEIQDVVILSAVRVPIGAFGGVLNDVPAARPATPGWAGVPADAVDEVITTGGAPKCTL